MWVEVTESDLAAVLSQSEIDAFRQDGSLDGSDSVAHILRLTVSTVRSYISCNGSVKMEPFGKCLPEGLIIPAMDYAAAKILKRMNVPLNEDRREALRRAEEIFAKIASGIMSVESWTADGSTDDLTRPATSPAFSAPTPERLLD